MLDAIRAIVQGHAGAVPNAALDAFIEFASNAQQRWQALIEPLPEGDAGRMPQGHYELGFEMRDVPAARTLAELRERMQVAGAVKHTGWGPFVSLNRAPFEPKPRGDLIEAWLGADGADRWRRTPAHCDFWQAHRNGRMYLQRGYDEDGVDYLQPGTSIDLTMPIWRVGEAALYAARLARQLDENPQILISCRYVGLQNRKLVPNGRLEQFFFAEYRCEDDIVDLGTQARASEIEDSLAELIHPMLAPLYERFDFYQLDMDLVVRELDKTRQNHF
jgi:hypothetical protein